MSIADVASVATYKPLVEDCLQRLAGIREESDSDSPVVEGDCVELLRRIRQIRPPADACDAHTLQLHNAAVETVFRDIFLDVVATIDISEPAFSQVWVLLDIITVLSDHELCEPGLGFWLVEELLDSQTIDGCRRVFDYLDSRRERITAHHFKSKSLVILRCCNELLRRLSRAEDTVFCGRVFVFLFQSFPLGDKSSVNLRGEFHLENVTTFDPTPIKSEDAIKPMELDHDKGTPVPVPVSGNQTPVSTQGTSRSTPVPRAKPDSRDEPPPDLDSLYPKFWSLQSLFSHPTRLFDPATLATFKDGITSTLSAFKHFSTSSPTPTNAAVDAPKPLKRKRSFRERGPSAISTSLPSSSSSTFNPKYLTNRDLFDLELHDPSFRRHILVQSLIMLDFLLSLSPSSKAKTANCTNKSVLYAFTLSESDVGWCSATRTAIANYLQLTGADGSLYYRMVDTVLSRDKNWVRWKAENCPSITREPVSSQSYTSARDTLMNLTRKTALPAPPGANDLRFLAKTNSLTDLKHPSKRKRVPSMTEYWKDIQGIDLDMDMADDDEKKELEERKAGRVWRALRSSGRRFLLSEKIRDGENLAALVESEDRQPNVEVEAHAHENGVGSKDSGAVEETEMEDQGATIVVVRSTSDATLEDDAVRVERLRNRHEHGEVDTNHGGASAREVEFHV